MFYNKKGGILMATIYKMKVQLEKIYALDYDETIRAPKDIVDFINSTEHYDLAINEQVIAIALDSKNKVLAYSDLYIGDMRTCNVNVSGIFKFLCSTPATRFILVHNHPSGDTTPSKDDLALTERVKTASILMGIEMLDHIIIGDHAYTSIFSYMKEKEVK